MNNPEIAAEIGLAQANEDLRQQRLTFDEWLRQKQHWAPIRRAMGSARQVQKGDATLSDDGETVVLFFSHSDFPAARFGYRVKTSSEDAYEEVWLAEELATGALHRIMRDAAPTPDDRGITWLRLHGQLLRADS